MVMVMMQQKHNGWWRQHPHRCCRGALGIRRMIIPFVPVSCFNTCPPLWSHRVNDSSCRYNHSHCRRQNKSYIVEQLPFTRYPITPNLTNGRPKMGRTPLQFRRTTGTPQVPHLPPTMDIVTQWTICDGPHNIGYTHDNIR